MLFANVVYYLKEEVYTLLQIGLNMIISFMFALYLAKVQPFVDPMTNKVNLLNEYCYYMISMCYFIFTDYNPNPVVKVYCGWFVVLVGILNLIWPNGYIMV